MEFAPFLSLHSLAVFGILFLIMAALGLAKAKHTLPARMAATALFLAVLFNPLIVDEQRIYKPDSVLIISDHTPSQTIDDREARRDNALKAIQSRLSDFKNIDFKTVRMGGQNETRIMDVVQQNLADIPPSRRGGIIILSDGQIHDIPENIDQWPQGGPVNLVLTGHKNEQDRRLEIINAPAYGLTGKEIEIKLKITDLQRRKEPRKLALTSEYNGETHKQIVDTEIPVTIKIPIKHAGQNIIRLSTPVTEGELSAHNNTATLLVNGIRDQLKVLLVSGTPHNGGRVWRDLLKSDPGISLVHFTILRDLNKYDMTPSNQLSLIEFPVRELFEIKLKDFDLVIFDNYKRRFILPDNYFQNIVDYVRDGGALLEASGPDFATDNSMYNSALAQIFPAKPTGKIIRKEFTPKLSTDGKFHPVTAPFKDAQNNWGPWRRQIEITPNSGTTTLMNGYNNTPLMVLSHIGKGRAAQIASDQIWLWARDYKNGGPHQELLRRTVHWLMKEPELDESALQLAQSGDQIQIQKRLGKNDKQDGTAITATTPRGNEISVTLEHNGDEWLNGALDITGDGIYSFEINGESASRRAIFIGSNDPAEWNNIHSTHEKLTNIISKNNGAAIYAQDWVNGNVNYSAVPRLSSSAIQIKKNNSYDVTQRNQSPALPAWLAALILCAGMVWLWWYEGKK